MKKTNNQNNLLHKSFSTKDFEIKSNEKGFGTITGIANKVNVIDSYGDMTVKGAFDKSIKNNPTVLALKDHWFSKVMGSSHLTLAQDGSLIVEMELNKDVQDGKETYVLAKQLLAAGRPLELSIGYIVNKSSEQEIDGQKVKVLEELDIKEVSVVPWAANSESTVTDVKKNVDSSTKDSNQDELELKTKMFQFQKQLGEK